MAANITTPSNMATGCTQSSLYPKTDPAKMAEVISRAHHAYPCTGSMSIDREIGDTFLHEAGCIARDTIFEAVIENLSKKGLDGESEAIREWKPPAEVG